MKLKIRTFIYRSGQVQYKDFWRGEWVCLIVLCRRFYSHAPLAVRELWHQSVWFVKMWSFTVPRVLSYPISLFLTNRPCKAFGHSPFRQQWTIATPKFLRLPDKGIHYRDLPIFSLSVLYQLLWQNKSHFVILDLFNIQLQRVCAFLPYHTAVVKVRQYEGTVDLCLHFKTLVQNLCSCPNLMLVSETVGRAPCCWCQPGTWNSHLVLLQLGIVAWHLRCLVW